MVLLREAIAPVACDAGAVSVTNPNTTVGLVYVYVYVCTGRDRSPLSEHSPRLEWATGRQRLVRRRRTGRGHEDRDAHARSLDPDSC